MESLGKAAVAEFVATFALVFVGAGAVILASGRFPRPPRGRARARPGPRDHGLGGRTRLGRPREPRRHDRPVDRGEGHHPARRRHHRRPARRCRPRGAPAPLRGRGRGVRGRRRRRARPRTGHLGGQGDRDRGDLTFFLVFAVFGTAVDDRGPWNKTAGFHDRSRDRVRHHRVRPVHGRGDEPRALVRSGAGRGRLERRDRLDRGADRRGIIAGVLYATVFLRSKEPATP